MSNNIPDGENDPWLKEQVDAYSAVLPNYKLYEKVLAEVLKYIVKPFAPTAIIQTRAKEIGSYTEKIQRKRAKYTDSLNQLTDLCGGRVITDTQTEVAKVCSCIERCFDIDWPNSLDVSQRLRPTEFGYRSIHYIIQFKPGVFPSKEVPVDIPSEIYGLKAEVQVRTVLEHAWATFYHDRAYKSGFTLPEQLQRRFASLAAALEEADQKFIRMETSLQVYQSGYGTFFTDAQAREEIGILRVVLEHDPKNLSAAIRIGRLCTLMGNWQAVVDFLEPYKETDHPIILRDLGLAYFKLDPENRTSSSFKCCQELLERASQLEQPDQESLVYLANTWRNENPKKARQLLRQAYELDPYNSYVLGHYLEFEISCWKSIEPVETIRPIITEALKRDRAQADVGVNLPWAFYNMGRFNLLLGEPLQALAAYTKAITLSTHDWMIETSLASLNRMNKIQNELHGFHSAIALLQLGWMISFPNAAPCIEISGEEISFPQPVVILTGGFDPYKQEELEADAALLNKAFKGFSGSVITGSKRLAELINHHESLSNSIFVYKPDVIEGEESLAVIQTWTQLIHSGEKPENIKVIALNRGSITSIELRLALALGGSLCGIQGQDFEINRLQNDQDWNQLPGIIKIHPDPLVLRTYLSAGKHNLDAEMREQMGRFIHQKYLSTRTIDLQAQDRSLSGWEQLTEDLRQSNLQQADHTIVKLQEVGYGIRPISDTKTAQVKFNDDQIEALAEMEHARWMIERLLAGWQYGSPKNVLLKISPHLIPWENLSDSVKEWDRQAVRNIPDNLLALGLEMYPIEEGGAQET